MTSHTFELSEDHQDFRAVVADFAQQALAPHVADWDAAHTLSLDAVKQMGDLGLFGLSAPEAYGGAGDFTSLCIAIEEIGRVDQSLGVTLEAAVGLGVKPLARFGTPAQQQRWLPDLIAGHALAGFGLTEPEAGSDAGATRTRAVLTDGRWVLNGRQAVHHQLRHRDHLAVHRYRPDRGPGRTVGRKSPPSSFPGTPRG